MNNQKTRKRQGLSTKVKWLVTIMIIVMVVLHQDVWLWNDPRLVFGFVPVGLAYHAAYSVLAAVVMAIIVKLAWPRHLERDRRSSKSDRRRA